MRRIDLVPEEAKKLQAVEWLKREFIRNKFFQAGFIIIFLIIALTAWEITAVWRFEIRLVNIKKEFAEKQKELDESKKLYELLISKKKNLKEQKIVLEKRLNTLQSAVSERILWIRALKAFPAVVSENIWFNKIALKKDILVLQGGALNNDIITNFMKALDDSSTFNDTKFNYTKRGDKKDEEDIIYFEVTTKLNGD